MSSRQNKMLLYLCFVMQYFLLPSHSTTHWFLNDEGKIQPQMDSIYQLRRPYDFLALLQQEERAKQVEQLKKELIQQKAQIDKNEDKDTQLEERIYRTNSDCLAAGKPLTEFDLYASASLDLNSADVNLEEHLDLESAIEGDEYLEPDCHSQIQLPYSLFLLEHLRAMQKRENLSATAEDENFSLYGEQDSIVWGHRVEQALQKDKSSWVLYTLGAQFWKIKGEINEAIECIRKAIYLSSREYRYIPLFYLGNILHRSHESEDAAIVLHMALDHNRRSSVIHEMLGCVYATIGYYNESVLCFENALHIKVKDENLVRLKHAVLCHAHLENALEKQLQSLEGTLNELRSYQKKHDEWLSLQQKLLLEQATPEMKLESRLEYEEQKIRESADGRGQDCFQYQQDGHTFLSCNMRRDQLETQGSSTELLLDLQSLLRTVEAEAMRLGQQVLKKKPSLPSNAPYVTPLLLANNDKLKSGVNNDDNPLLESSVDPLFSPKDCAGFVSLPPKDSIATVFLPSENKGFAVNSLLDIITMIFDEDLSPTCDPPSTYIEGVDSLGSLRSKSGLAPTQPDIQGSPYLTAYGFHLYDTETEVKLASAIRKEGPHRWVFLNLAGLYWRIYGNLANSLDCLRLALVKSPPLYLDVPLVNLASLLYRAGHLEDAITVAQQAVQINPSEIETHFLLGNLYQAQGNLTGARFHYQKVLGFSPRHPDARQYYTFISCHLLSVHDDAQFCAGSSGCSFQGDTCDDSSFGSGGSCSQMDGGSFVAESASGESKGEKCSPGSSEAMGKRRAEATKTIQNKQIHVKIGLGSEGVEPHPDSAPIQDDPLPEVFLRTPGGVMPPPSVPPGICDKAYKINDIKTFTSTWLSVSAKSIHIGDYVVGPPKEGTPLEEPICPGDFPASLHTFDHLAGVKHRSKLPHHPELGLKEAFQTLVDRNSQHIDLVATRIARSLKKNETSWVLGTAAALYWRVLGNATRAVDCLRWALHWAPRDMKDIPLVSLTNIFHRSDLLNDALIVANMALEISPHFVVIHFTLANVYATKGDLERAIQFYQSTLELQSTFEPARERLRIIQCSLNKGS